MDELKWLFIFLSALVLGAAAQEAFEFYAAKQTEQKAIEQYGQCVSQNPDNTGACDKILDKFETQQPGPKDEDEEKE